MKQTASLLILSITLLTVVACEGERPSARQLPHLGDTPYQEDSILVTYANNPERAHKLLDSALLLGNISDYRGQFIRAKIYCKSLMEQRQDSAILICKELLRHDSVRNDPTEQENILDMLITTARAKPDYEQYMYWATQKAELCQKQGQETERWRTEADIGLVMTHLGQENEGLAKLDEAISHLDAPGSIDRMDAFIVACKRKINALNDLHRYNEIITMGQRILDRLDHYDQHAKDYAEDSYRLSWSDNPSDRDRYLDFSRAQAWGFMAQGYSLTPAPSPKGEGSNYRKAREYLALFDQSGYGKTFMARRMIAPTQMALGMYDEALATYDEIERRMAADTLNEDYAVILRSRAIAAREKKHYAEAYYYQTRNADLSKILSDSLIKGKAHDYAARYHAQEQQLEIQEKQAEAERSHIISLAVAVVALLAIAFAVYFFRQKRIVSEKNRALVRMINGMPIEPEPEEEELEEQGEDESDDGGPIIVQSSIFNDIDAAIRSEQLYKNVNLQRQDICNHFGISRHTLNNLLAENAGGLSFPQYVNNIRLEVALRLLREDPAKTISAIATEVGFSPANLREQFKRKYGMTPAEYRQNQ
ncbi:MAG: helix-turn-helix domain-containing protein [Prevotella sp.]|nr:helix-turn-helix domain-containing protein [Prevotella sp.]